MLEINISQLFAQQQAETCRVVRGITSFVQGWGTPVVNWNPNDDKDPIAVLSAAQTQHLRDGLSSQVEPPTSIDPKVLSLLSWLFRVSAPRFELSSVAFVSQSPLDRNLKT